MYFLGIDLGSHYTKFVVSDADGAIVHVQVIPTLHRHRDQMESEWSAIRGKFDPSRVCATGYGRDTLAAGLKKPELICAAVGVSSLFPESKTIIDIGGEDIKIIECGPSGQVDRFFMNDKCSAGTGAFITEIAERAEIDVSEMSGLAESSTSTRAMNSFCTVFAKTEILSWKFDGVSAADMARGIYLSVVDRVCKLPMRTDGTVLLCGGVAAHHPYVESLLSDRLAKVVRTTPYPQFMIAYGASLIASGR